MLLSRSRCSPLPGHMVDFNSHYPFLWHACACLCSVQPAQPQVVVLTIPNLLNRSTLRHLENLCSSNQTNFHDARLLDRRWPPKVLWSVINTPQNQDLARAIPVYFCCRSTTITILPFPFHFFCCGWAFFF